jgi:glutaconate CoA-transferase subunit A
VLALAGEESSMDRQRSLQDAARLIQDGQVITVGGTLCQRVPAAFVRELARQGTRDLELVKPSPGYDLDVLAAVRSVRRARFGIASLEQPFGIARNFRKAVEAGVLDVTENACPTIMASFQAAAFGVPFQPVAGLDASDIPRASGFAKVADPFTGQQVYVVPAIRPDWAIIHVNEADVRGNARIYGTPVWDRLMSRAAKRCILTAERILPSQHFADQPELTVIPELLVEAVVHVPGGAWPTSCYPDYDIDEPAMRAYLSRSQSLESLRRYLDETVSRDRAAAEAAA